MEVPQFILAVAKLQEGEEILSMSAWASDEYISAKDMATKIHAGLYMSGTTKEELDTVEIVALRWGWIERPALRNPDQCLSSEPFGQLWVVYTKSAKISRVGSVATVASGEEGIAQVSASDNCGGGILRL